MTVAKGTIHVLTEKGSSNTPNKYSNLYPKTSADQVVDLDIAIEEKVTSMISYNATKTSGDVIGTLNINGTDHVLYSTPDTLATTSTNGLMSAADKTKLDDLTSYTLPTASKTLKGGIKIGSGLSMEGDTLNVTIQNSSGGGRDIGTLDTVPATVDGGLWLNVTDNAPVLWLRKGEYNYEFLPNANVRYTGSNSYLKAYLPFDTSPTADACGNVWTISPLINDGGSQPIQLDRDIKKFGTSSLRILNVSYGLSTDSIININAEKWTFDGWYYRDTSETSFHLGLENSHTYAQTGITILYDGIYVPNATTTRSYSWITNTFALGEWTHVAIVKNGSSLLFFKNGQLDETLTLTGSFSTGGGFELGRVGGYSGHLAHYDRLRFYEGIARWTENFTPPTASDYSDFTPSVTNDYSEYLVSYLPFENSTTEDTCGNTWTAYGNVSLEIAPVKFGAKSIHCPAGAYIRAQNIFNLYAEKWTFDCWANYQSIQKENAGALAFGTVSTTGAQRYGVIAWDKAVGIAGNNDNWQLDQATPNNFGATLNQWIHIAIVKNGTTITFYENGQTVASHVLTETPLVDNYFWLGATPYSTATDVYFDNVHFFEGIALWTSDFTPPTTSNYSDFIPSTTQNTSQSGSFSGTAGILDTVPSSVNGSMWLDVSGDTPIPKFYYDGMSYPLGVTVAPSLPAELTAYLPFLSNLEDVRRNEWTTIGNPSIVDGALYLNGSSYLQFSNAAFLLSASTYTIDFWARPTTNTGTLFHFLNSLVSSAQEYGSWIKLDFYQGNIRLVGYGGSDYDASTTYPHTLNTRHHFALTYDGTIFKVYVDGQCLLTKERTTSINGAFQIGGSSLDNVVGGFTGYIDHLRIFDGLVRWTENFTPPTANDYSNFTSSNVQNTISSGSSSEAVGILDTVPVTIDGGLWYEVTNDMPAIWLHKGNYDYRYSHDRLRFSGDTIDNLVAYLPFTSTLDDVLGNEWITMGNPQIQNGSLYLDGSSHLTNNTISDSIGVQPFTIDFWASATNGGSFFGTFNLQYGSSANRIYNRWVGVRWAGGTPGFNFYGNDPSGTITVTPSTRHHYAVTYDETTIRLFVDGVLSVAYDQVIILGSNFCIGSSADLNERLTGSIDHFQIYKGIALWTSNFTPPTTNDYA